MTPGVLLAGQEQEPHRFYPRIFCSLVQEMLKDQRAASTEGACAGWEPVFLVNTWLSTALNPSFSAAKFCHPPPQRAEGFQGSTWRAAGSTGKAQAAAGTEILWFL